MKSQAIVHGKIIRKYKIPLDEIENLNNEYEKYSSELHSFGDHLAGNLKSEKEVTHLIARLPIIHTLYDCMKDSFQQNLLLENLQPETIKVKDYNITHAWINDMKEEEYQPPHTHNIGEAGTPKGYSTVLFLKTPQIVIKHRKERMGGHLTFINSSGDNATSFEPITGDFYIFHASHQHLVLPYTAEVRGSIRRSMSFNYEVIAF